MNPPDVLFIAGRGDEEEKGETSMPSAAGPPNRQASPHDPCLCAQLTSAARMRAKLSRV